MKVRYKIKNLMANLTLKVFVTPERTTTMLTAPYTTAGINKIRVEVPSVDPRIKYAVYKTYPEIKMKLSSRVILLCVQNRGTHAAETSIMRGISN
jgi:hypothetical protein